MKDQRHVFCGMPLFCDVWQIAMIIWYFCQMASNNYGMMVFCI